MPEGDAVRRTARRLDEALAGRTVASSDLRVPRFATVDFAGARVLGTHVAGKHLLTRFDDGRTLHSHLRMDGRWATGPVGTRVGPGHQIRAVLRTDRTQAIGLRIAMVEVIATGREGDLVGHLGPDILAEQWDEAGSVAALAEAADRPLGEALLDQRVVSGLGTIWVSEAAFVAGRTPWSPTGSVTDPSAVLAVIRRRMQRSLAAPGRREMDSPAVYQRTGLPCRACGAVIRAGQVGREPQRRTLYWCPNCQQGPSPGAFSRPGSAPRTPGR